MPKSKRATVVALTKTGKKTKEQKGELIDKIQKHTDAFGYVWVFQISNMRNKCLKEVREQWKGSVILMGKNAVMRKALGSTPEEEHKPGCARIANELEGEVGLLFTDEDVKTVTEWFESYTVPDYARAGNEASKDFILPEGPIMMDGETAAHSIEPQLRKLGLSSKLIKGVPTLSAAHQVAREGKKLTADEAHLLKLFNVPMATFQIFPQTCVDLKSGEVVHEGSA